MNLKGFLPVVARELREAARQRATYWNRVMAVAIALVIFYLLWLATRREPAHEVGRAVFYALSMLAGMICLLAGSSVADSISREKREGTLGLLFLTNLSGYDVVAGKVVANSLGAAYRVIAILPILGIVFLFGGVEMEMYVRVILTCANTMLLSLAIAAYWSSSVTTSWAAVLGWLGTMAFLVVGFPLVISIAVKSLHNLYITPDMLKYYLALYTVSPGFTAVMAAGPKAYLGQFQYLFWVSLAVQHLIAWRAFQLASVRTQRIWRQQELQLSRREKGNRFKDVLRRGLGWLRWRNQPVGNEEPVAWLVRRSRLGLNVTLLIFALATLVYCWGWHRHPHDWRDSDNFGVVMALMHLWLLGWMAGEAATWVFRDRQSGAMELILATPLKTADILRMHFRGINHKLLWPVLWVLAVDIFFMLHDRTYYHGVRMSWFTYAMWFSLMGMLLFNLFVLRWTATWMGLVARNEFNAAVGGMIWLSLPTWGTIVGATFVTFLLGEVFKWMPAREFAREFEEWHLLVSWLILGSLNNLVMLWISRRECLKLRDYASLRPETGLWAQLRYVAGLFTIRNASAGRVEAA